MMYLSLFTDEFYQDVYEVLPKVAAWGMKYVDFRAMINGKPIEKQSVEELKKLKSTLDSKRELFSRPYAKCIFPMLTVLRLKWKSLTE